VRRQTTKGRGAEGKVHRQGGPHGGDAVALAPHLHLGQVDLGLTTVAAEEPLRLPQRLSAGVLGLLPGITGDEHPFHRTPDAGGTLPWR